MELATWLLPALGVFLIGLSKAGFATGLGMLSTPLVASALPPREALGVVLPLLCAADLFTIFLFWKKWDAKLVAPPIFGSVAGIAAGIFFVNSISPMLLRKSIGVTALVLGVLLVVRRLWKPEAVWVPKLWQGLLVGAVAGFSSTISHGAGPIIALYLLAQRVDKSLFVATSALYFTVGNLMKVPPYLAAQVITQATLLKSLWLLPAVPVGVFAGWLANRHLPQKAFEFLAYGLLLITAVDLIVR